MTLPSDVIRFGRDLLLPDDASASILPTATGDLPAVEGRTTVEAAIRRRVLTLPGSLLHRPDFGAGLPDYTEKPATPGNRSRLANAIRGNLLQDPRISDAKAIVSAGYPDGSEGPALSVEISWTPSQEEQFSVLTVEPTS